MKFFAYLKDFLWYTIKTYLLPFMIVIVTIVIVFWRLLGDEFTFNYIRLEIIYFTCFFLLVSFTTYEMKGHKNE
ncbi:hypothetical protein AN960_09155 [Bacillus sp. FJAT-25509]|uniref:hypothetical protein n=1 Tax=Bacillaceae TaxID=186817 RepID=UPI0006F4BFCC|nr:hypothetical protein [Bacillus sp. FJAT-25509]KQL40113.1 hypothetical protein AN960_09155 [Bacillus sp. FJAT-25509]